MLNNFSASARDAKRLSDVRSLYTKLTLENTKGTKYEDLINVGSTSSRLINGETRIVAQGVVNFGAIRENRDNFLDPITNSDYPVAFHEAGLTASLSTEARDPSVIEIATINEENNKAVVMGNYFPIVEGDTPGLIENGMGEIITNNSEELPYGYTILDGIVIRGGGTDEKGFTWQNIILTYNGKSTIIMDRNLGASEVFDGTENREAYGDFFQWGNNFPFPNSGEITTSNTQIETASRPYESETYIIGNTDWLKIPNNDLWGDVTDTPFGNNITARQGPCPDGWHIPTYSEWDSLVRAWFGYNGEDPCILGLAGASCKWTENTSQAKFYNELKLPPSGRRQYGNGSLMLSPFYRSSTTSSTNVCVIGFTPDYIDTSYCPSWRGTSLPIRCFKN